MADKHIQRMTRQRQIIIDEIRNSKAHPTADELLEMARKSLPKISLGTIYRNLDILVKTGAIRRIEAGNGKARYDGDLEDHFHLRCLNCGIIEDMHIESFIKIQPKVFEARNFKVMGHNIEFFGICNNCKLKSNQT